MIGHTKAEFIKRFEIVMFIYSLRQTVIILAAMKVALWGCYHGQAVYSVELLIKLAKTDILVPALNIQYFRVLAALVSRSHHAPFVSDMFAAFSLTCTP